MTPASPVQIDGIEGLKARLGDEIGVTDWYEVTQDEVTEFGKLTGDTYWIHTDPERAKDSAFGGTIAHGFFTLSLAPGFAYGLYEFTGIEFGVNYGVDNLRFPSPMLVGGRVRMRARLKHVEELPNGARFTMGLTFEQEGHEKPVCVADWLGQLRYPAPSE